jgi:uracil-DNA glycosylase
MTIPLNESTRKKLEDTLRYYEDIGVREYFLDRAPQAAEEADARAVSAPVLPAVSVLRDRVAAAAESAMLAGIPVPQGPSLFEAIERVQDDSLERIRADIGDCKRCRLCERRTNIVFGDGNGKAELVFIGEGPGHDEDVQGLPFVGRAGKLLTQMIEAMGLQRSDVYICNVVKCRPPENRAPEKDEIAICSPFLLRQLDVIQPKVIVCLGAVALKALLGADRGITHLRGQWLEYRGTRLMPTYHPAYLLRNPSAKGDVWKDLQKVMNVLGLPPKKGARP